MVTGFGGLLHCQTKCAKGIRGEFDRRVNRWIYDHRGPQWVQESGRDLSAFGGVTGLTLIVAAVVGFLLITRRRRAMLLVIVATMGGLALSVALKGVFDRPRPPLRPPGTIVYSTSFPSGHSMLSAVTYLTLGSLLASVTPGRRIKLYLVTLH